MSQLGQKQTFRNFGVMFALPPVTDIVGAAGYVPKCQIRRDAPPTRSGDQWLGRRRAAEALSSGLISDFAENGFVR
jgi:hypothetical protein